VSVNAEDGPADVIVLTGAGVSAESGLRTFRDADGLWEEHRVEDVATPEAFARDPELVHRFYSARRAQLAEVAPNPAHRALARFAIQNPGRLLLVTQNVDDLHERAGSPEVLHMHGSLLEVRCTACARVLSWREPTTTASVCPICAARGRLRPNIVWFGEVPFALDQIDAALRSARLFVAIGTSGNVYPAAGFAQHARAAGARTVELNLEPSGRARSFDEGVYGRASEVVPAFFAGL
jgi:NAD-dependent deacetylase